MVARIQRWWLLCAAPFLGAFAAHPCVDHLFMLLLGMGIAALGMRKQHCCVNDCLTEEKNNG